MTKQYILQRLYSLGILLLGSLFLWAAISKISDLAAFAQSLKQTTWLPNWILIFALYVIPSTELIIGLCLLAQIALKEALLVGLLLMTVFLFVSIDKAFAGTPGCGCVKLRSTGLFEGLSGWWIVARNAAFTLAFVIVSLKPTHFLVTNRINEGSTHADSHDGLP